MTSLVHWSAGTLVGLTWNTTYFTASNFYALPNGSCVGSSALNNATALDQYLDLSFKLTTGTATTAGTSYIAAFLLPLNQDGTTYGDASIAASGTLAGTPGSVYYVGVAPLGAVVASGAAATGTISRIIIPPGGFILALQNNLGNALLSGPTTATVSVRTYCDGIG